MECKFGIPFAICTLLTITSSPSASWHTDYRDTAYIYIGGLPFELSEGDIVTIFSQYGEPTYINLVRDKETGKSKGFAFLKYEDQRSTDLAVDNLGGAVIMNRTLKVDHTRYKKKDDEPDPGHHLDQLPEEEDGEGRRKRRRTSESESEEEQRPMLKEELELAKLIQEHDEDDPMKAYLIQEKKEEVALALARVKGGKDSERSHKHRHRHHHRSRRSKEEDEVEEKDSSQRSHHRKEGHSRRRSRSREGEERSYRKRDEERLEEYRPRKRSPRRDDYERDYDAGRRRDRSRERTHRPGRDSRD
jgi:RNA-binding motif X-linked protein 2